MPGRPASTMRVGALQAAQLAVQVPESGRDSDELAFVLEGLLGHVEGGGERVRERPEPRLLRPGRGELEQRCSAFSIRPAAVSSRSLS